MGLGRRTVREGNSLETRFDCTECIAQAQRLLDMAQQRWVPAHTERRPLFTASDALWAELPVLTWRGQSFASRVAASLLNAIGTPELIVESMDDYEALAIELATHPESLAHIRQKNRGQPTDSAAL